MANEIEKGATMTDLEKKSEEYASEFIDELKHDIKQAYKDGYKQGQDSIMFEFAIEDRNKLLKEIELLKTEQKDILEDNDYWQDMFSKSDKENAELKAQIEKMKQSCLGVMKVQANNLCNDYNAGIYNGMVIIYNSCFLDEKNELEKDFCSKNKNKWELAE